MTSGQADKDGKGLRANKMYDILYQFNEKYVPFAGTSIVSLLENNKSIENIRFFLVVEAVTENSKEKLKKQIMQYNREVIFIDADELIKRLKGLDINDYRGSYSPNLKVVVSWFLPEDVTRVLYIDSDTIVEGSIEKIFEIEMEKKPIAMSLDSVCKVHKRELGFLSNAPYYNSGVILYDMERWREMECTERIVEHLKTSRAHYMAPDQDLLNVVLQGEIADLGPACNLQPMHCDYTYERYSKYFGQKIYYSKEEIEDAIQCPIIYHTFRYLGEFPWHKNSMHPNVPLFDKYLAMSLWFDYEKQVTERNDIIFRIERLLYRKLPKGIFIMIFKVCYEMFMWKSNKDSVAKKNNVRM